ncbi:unnamed protein product [Blepharisma stoltei]|uniref:Receptor expression-enhancing protein n=1 Tax=Blepharisma stoltei TaxID=1481888 RepID=A0AAU9JTN8_9CILI|nr:unnamed protein product [Blepharisma stoltei]
MDQINQFLFRLNESTKNNTILKLISSKTGLQTSHIVVILGACVFGFMMFGIGADIIGDFIGFIYPAYMSFKAIESAETDDDKQWLTYWVVYAICRFIDDSASFLFSWVPFYHPFKLLFLFFLFSPQIKGALILYENIVQPILLKNQDKIDKGIESFKEEATKAAAIAKEQAVKQGTNYLLKANN